MRTVMAVGLMLWVAGAAAAGPGVGQKKSESGTRTEESTRQEQTRERAHERQVEEGRSYKTTRTINVVPFIVEAIKGYESGSDHAATQTGRNIRSCKIYTGDPRRLALLSLNRGPKRVWLLTNWLENTNQFRSRMNRMANTVLLTSASRRAVKAVKKPVGCWLTYQEVALKAVEHLTERYSSQQAARLAAQEAVSEVLTSPEASREVLRAANRQFDRLKSCVIPTGRSITQGNFEFNCGPLTISPRDRLATWAGTPLITAESIKGQRVEVALSAEIGQSETHRASTSEQTTESSSETDYSQSGTEYSFSATE